MLRCKTTPRTAFRFGAFCSSERRAHGWSRHELLCGAHAPLPGRWLDERRPLCADPGSLCPSHHLHSTVLWKQIIQRNGGVITSTLNVSCLAKVTDGFTQGHIVQVVHSVLTDRRVRQQALRPLAALEFIAALSSLSPVYQEEEDSFKVNGAPAWPAQGPPCVPRLLPRVPWRSRS